MLTEIPKYQGNSSSTISSRINDIHVHTIKRKSKNLVNWVKLGYHHLLVPMLMLLGLLKLFGTQVTPFCWST